MTINDTRSQAFAIISATEKAVVARMLCRSAVDRQEPTSEHPAVCFLGQISNFMFCLWQDLHVFRAQYKYSTCMTRNIA